MSQQTLTVPRSLGGTLIIQYTPGPSATIPTLSITAVFRDGTVQATYRDGTQQAQHRDGTANATGR